ncbi:hypothetical protein PBF_01940 [Cytobacillus firmus DS1]|uniref:Uncharacterized protein n=1 Tax=Cytobacillus firmus DS1 TaxID=1307436 RepID=W7L170_CYTFI|nr:hypothetical protein PBF_01940 [Cytobacillus firmus DS1]
MTIAAVMMLPEQKTATESIAVMTMLPELKTDAEEDADVAGDAAGVAGIMLAEQKTTAENIAVTMYAVQVTYGTTET